jgi:hypothetical protein
MPLSWNEIKSRATAFSNEWKDEVSEDAEVKSFWDGFFNIFEIKNMLSIAGDYSDLDYKSFSYRYPIDKNGNYSAEKSQIINITSLTKSMEGLLDSIEAINFGLDIETDKEEKIFEILSNFSDN